MLSFLLYQNTLLEKSCSSAGGFFLFNGLRVVCPWKSDYVRWPIVQPQMTERINIAFWWDKN
jgi:hypothetical protein